MERQVLTIEQVFELQNLGFNIIENSSSVVILKENVPVIVSKEIIEKNIFGITDKMQDMFCSMTVKDLYDALPCKIWYEDPDYGSISYTLDIKKEVHISEVTYISDYHHSKIPETFEDKYLINALFKLLIWILSNKIRPVKFRK